MQCVLSPDNVQNKTPFEEKFGIERIVEVLECNMWPSMIQKQPGSLTSKEEKTKTHVDPMKQPSLLDTQVGNFATDLEKFLSNIMDEENDENDESFGSFERTLSGLSALKNSSQNLPDSQRRELAAKVAEAFLRFVDDEE